MPYAGRVVGKNAESFVIIIRGKSRRRVALKVWSSGRSNRGVAVWGWLARGCIGAGISVGHDETQPSEQDEADSVVNVNTVQSSIRDDDQDSQGKEMRNR